MIVHLDKSQAKTMLKLQDAKNVWFVCRQFKSYYAFHFIAGVRSNEKS